MSTSESDEELAARLNLETGRLDWAELQRYFARGNVLAVSRELDLIEVATALVRDDSDTVAEWKTRGQVRAARDEDARRWQRDAAGFWAVVVAPWVVVQEAVD